MGSPGFLVLGILSALMWLATRSISKHPNLTGRNRALRNHLKEFNKLWAVLVFYYAIQFFWPYFSAKTPPWGTQPGLEYLTPIFIWHLAVAILLACANLWLRRASLELEISQLPGTETKVRYPDDTLSTPMLRLLRSTEKYIAGTFIAAVLLLIIGPMFGEYGPKLTAMAEEFQIIITSALFVSLGFAYSRILHAWLIAALAFLFAVLQLPYSFKVVPGELNTYSWILVSLKLVFGFFLCVKVWRYAQNHPEPPEADPKDALRRVAKRLDAHASQQPLFQLVAGTTAVALWVLGLSGFYAIVIDWARRYHFPPMSIGLLRIAFTIPLLLITQYLLYQVATRLRFRVHWAQLAEGVLKETYTYDTRPSTKLAPGHFTLRRAAGHGGKLAGHGPARQVILLHGLLNDGASAWGLLPIFLLGRPGIERVHVLSYSHKLMAMSDTIEAIAKELRIRISRTLMAEFDGNTVIIGHSLGAILILKMLPKLLKEATEARKNLDHICLVGPPLLGSRFSNLAFPFPWSWILGRRSSFLADALKKGAESLPSAITAKDGEQHLPTLSLIPGTRDKVVGNLIEFTPLPATVFEAPAFHGLGMTFVEDELTGAYFSAVREPERPVVLARRVAEILGIRTVAGEGGILRLVGEELTNAQVVGDSQEETLPGDGGTLGRSFADELEQNFYATGGAKNAWGPFWRSLQVHVALRRRPSIATVPWPDGRTLLLYLNRLTGCFGVSSSTPEGAAPKRRHPMQHLGVGARLLSQRFPSLDPGAPTGALAETCGHLERLESQEIEFSELAARAVIDRDGTYYGVYFLRGKVIATEGRTQLLVHIGAAGSPRGRELEFSAFEENRHSPLQVVEQLEGKHCYLDVGGNRKKQSAFYRLFEIHS